MDKQKKEAEVIFEQPLMTLRVVKTNKGEFDIEVAMLEGPSIGITEPNEFIAKTINAGLLKGYISELTKVQENMRAALTSLQDIAQQEKEEQQLELEGEALDPQTSVEKNTEDNKSGDA